MRDDQNVRPVGRVVGLWRYPVKSMAPEPLNEVEVSWHELRRRSSLAFVRNGVANSGFPWLTLRERGDLNHYHPSFVDPAQPDKSKTTVRTPSGVVSRRHRPGIGNRALAARRVGDQTGPRHLRHLPAVAHHDSDDRPPGAKHRHAPRRAAFSTEHIGGRSRSDTVPRGWLGRLYHPYRWHEPAHRQARWSLRRHHDRSDNDGAQCRDPAHGRSRPPGVPRGLRLHRATGPHCVERSRIHRLSAVRIKVRALVTGFTL